MGGHSDSATTQIHYLQIKHDRENLTYVGNFVPNVPDVPVVTTSQIHDREIREHWDESDGESDASYTDGIIPSDIAEEVKHQYKQIDIESDRDDEEERDVDI